MEVSEKNGDRRETESRKRKYLKARKRKGKDRLQRMEGNIEGRDE